MYCTKRNSGSFLVSVGYLYLVAKIYCLESWPSRIKLIIDIYISNIYLKREWGNFFKKIHQRETFRNCKKCLTFLFMLTPKINLKESKNNNRNYIFQDLQKFTLSPM